MQTVSEEADLRARAYAAYDAFNRNDLDTLISYFHPDAEIRDDPAWTPNPGIWRGREEIRRYWETYRNTWDELHGDVEELRVAGETAVAWLAAHAKSRISGVPLDFSLAHLARFRDGKIVEFVNFRSWDEALRAAGLTP